MAAGETSRRLQSILAEVLIFRAAEPAGQSSLLEGAGPVGERPLPSLAAAAAVRQARVQLATVTSATPCCQETTRACVCIIPQTFVHVTIIGHQKHADTRLKWQGTCPHTFVSRVASP